MTPSTPGPAQEAVNLARRSLNALRLDLPESIVAAHGKIVEDAFSALAAAASPAAEAGGAREARTAAFEEAAKAVERLECVWCTDGICLPEGPAQTRAFQAAAQTIRNLASRPEAPTDGQ